MRKIIFPILIFLLLPCFASAMIMDNFTSIDNDGDVVDYIFAFDNSLSNYPVFIILLSIIIVASSAVYSWSNDAVSSMLFGFFIGTFLALLAAIIVNGEGQRLLSWEKFSFIATLLVLTGIYKKVSD